MAAQPHEYGDTPFSDPYSEDGLAFLRNDLTFPEPSLAPYPSCDSGGDHNRQGDNGEYLRLLLLDLLRLEQSESLPPNESSPQKGLLRHEQLLVRVQQLEKQVSDPEMLSQILSPVLVQLIAHHAARSPEQFARALSRVTTRMIEIQNQQDSAAMSRALATAIPGAIAHQLGTAPDEIVEAIAPAMGQAIQAQIRLNPDSMVDSLYPVIGSTISKYMGEVLHDINHRLEQSLSPKRLLRHLWLRWRGISEAEMILRDALPFHVQAAFLIHKTSGLVMAEVQQRDRPALEADLLAGMLTAIRGFASECTTNQYHHSELTKIDYDDFQIMMEVAGSCYIAVIVKGEVPSTFLQQLRKVLSAIILNHGFGQHLDAYSGDTSTIPPSVPDLLMTLVQHPGQLPTSTPKSLVGSRIIQVFLGGVLLLVLLLGGWTAWQGRRQALKQQIMQAFQETPTLMMYRLNAQVGWRHVVLSGQVSSPSLRRQAVLLATELMPQFNINDQITVIPISTPEAIQADIQQATQIINQLLRVELMTAYDPQQQQVVVQTPFLSETDFEHISQALTQIPGVKSLIVKTIAHTQPWEQRVYFDRNQTQVASGDEVAIINPLVQYLQENPDVSLNIIGHTDRRGEQEFNQVLGEGRAKVVQARLLQAGIAPDRLFFRNQLDLPPDVLASDPLSKSRCVRFELVETTF